MGKHYDELSNLIDRFSVGDHVKHIGQYSEKILKIFKKNMII